MDCVEKIALAFVGGVLTVPLLIILGMELTLRLWTKRAGPR